MSRFQPVLHATWLALKRNGVVRDIRRKICSLVQRNLFNWETHILREERTEQGRYALLGYSHGSAEIAHQICATVERCPRLPFPTGEDRCLRLQRVKLRMRKYSCLLYHWNWLQD